MRINFSPIVFLALCWLALSGHYTILILSLGVISCLSVQWILMRMDIVDHEGYPIHLIPWRILTYWIWLIKEILLSSWAVGKMILTPRLKIHPRVARLPVGEMGEVLKATYANSITLTPGTLTLEVSPSEIEIHTLQKDLLEALERGDMLNRIRKLESTSHHQNS